MLLWVTGGCCHRWLASSCLSASAPPTLHLFAHFWISQELGGVGHGHLLWVTSQRLCPYLYSLRWQLVKCFFPEIQHWIWKSSLWVHFTYAFAISCNLDWMRHCGEEFKRLYFTQMKSESRHILLRWPFWAKDYICLMTITVYVLHFKNKSNHIWKLWTHINAQNWPSIRLSQHL